MTQRLCPLTRDERTAMYLLEAIPLSQMSEEQRKTWRRLLVRHAYNDGVCAPSIETLSKEDRRHAAL